MLKDQFEFNLVIIQCGYYFEVYNEDAEYFQKEFDFEVFDRGINVLGTGFPVSSLDKWISIFKERNLTYAIVEQINPFDQENNLIRQVVYSTNKEAIGLNFRLNKKIKLKNIKEGLKLEDTKKTYNYKKAKKTYSYKIDIEKLKKDNIANDRPENFGLPWTEDDKKTLIDKFNNNESLDDITKFFKRGPSSIIRYLKKYGLKKY